MCKACNQQTLSSFDFATEGNQAVALSKEATKPHELASYSINKRTSFISYLDGDLSVTLMPLEAIRPLLHGFDLDERLHHFIRCIQT